MTKTRRIKRAEVKRLALCKRGKNGLTTLYKADGTAEYATLTKGDAEKGELLTVVWPLGLADADGDFADTKFAIDSMMSSLIANGGSMDIEHEGEVLPREAVEIVEVFEIRKSDERFHGWKSYDGTIQDVTGGAAARIQLNDPALRASYRNGDWDGVSIFGPAAVEVIDTKAASERVAARMGGGNPIDMTKEELQAILTSFKGEVAEMVKSAAAPVQPKAEVVEPIAKSQGPQFSGDPMNPEDLASFERELRSHEIQKRITSGEMTADEIADMRKSLTEKVPSVDELVASGIDAKPEDSAELRKAQLQVFKLQKSSNVSKANERTDDEDGMSDLEKSSLSEAMAIAGLVNARTGRGSEGGNDTMRVVRA